MCFLQSHMSLCVCLCSRDLSWVSSGPETDGVLWFFAPFLYPSFFLFISFFFSFFGEAGEGGVFSWLGERREEGREERKGWNIFQYSVRGSIPERVNCNILYTHNMHMCVYMNNSVKRQKKVHQGGRV